MKTTLLGVGIAAVVGVGVYYWPTEEVAVITQEVIETVVEEDKYGNLDKMIEEAQAASSTDIEIKLEDYRQELLKQIEDEVKANYIKELETTISSEAY